MTTGRCRDWSKHSGIPCCEHRFAHGFERSDRCKRARVFGVHCGRRAALRWLPVRLRIFVDVTIANGWTGRRSHMIFGINHGDNRSPSDGGAQGTGIIKNIEFSRAAI